MDKPNAKYHLNNIITEMEEHELVEGVIDRDQAEMILANIFRLETENKALRDLLNRAAPLIVQICANDCMCSNYSDCIDGDVISGRQLVMEIREYIIPPETEQPEGDG